MCKSTRVTSIEVIWWEGRQAIMYEWKEIQRVTWVPLVLLIEWLETSTPVQKTFLMHKPWSEGNQHQWPTGNHRKISSLDLVDKPSQITPTSKIKTPKVFRNMEDSNPSLEIEKWTKQVLKEIFLSWKLLRQTSLLQPNHPFYPYKTGTLSSASDAQPANGLSGMWL